MYHYIHLSFSIIQFFLSNPASICNMANKGLHGEKQNKFNQIFAPSGNWAQDLFIMPMLYWLS